MHIPDGMLPARVCIGGYAIAGLFTWYSLRQINRQQDPSADVPKASLLTAAFFAASSIHIPIPPASVHLILNGALGAVLGYYAFPAILIGLLFQALVLGHGGLTTLGINALIIGLPALVASRIFQLRYLLRQWQDRQWTMAVFSFLAGASGIGIATVLFSGLTLTTIPSGFDITTERTALYGLLVAHIPLMGIEGAFTALLISFLQRVKPEVLQRGKA